MNGEKQIRPLVKTVVVGPLDVNCYLFGCPEHKEVFVIDPGDNVANILTAAKQSELKIKGIINTHAHADHIGGNLKIKRETSANIMIHKDDSFFLTSPENREMAAFYGVSPSPDADRLLNDGDLLELCTHFSLKVIHTPGHTKGGICLLWEDILFSGDTLFSGSIGRSDLPGGDHETLIGSIKSKLLVLDNNVKVFPGHGPESSILNEKKYNPFLR